MCFGCQSGISVTFPANRCSFSPDTWLVCEAQSSFLRNNSHVSPWWRTWFYVAFRLNCIHVCGSIHFVYFINTYIVIVLTLATPYTQMRHICCHIHRQLKGNTVHKPLISKPEGRRACDPRVPLIYIRKAVFVKSSMFRMNRGLRRHTKFSVHSTSRSAWFAQVPLFH